VKALRKLVLGETWALPLGIAAAVGAAALLRAAAGTGEFWTRAGGFALLVLLVLAFAAALRFPR